MRPDPSQIFSNFLNVWGRAGEPAEQSTECKCERRWTIRTRRVQGALLRHSLLGAFHEGESKFGIRQGLNSRARIRGSIKVHFATRLRRLEIAFALEFPAQGEPLGPGLWLTSDEFFYVVRRYPHLPDQDQISLATYLVYRRACARLENDISDNAVN